MCKWGTHTKVKVTIPAVYRGHSVSHTGKDRVEYKKIDSCIAPIVDALNKANIQTLFSCCGHEKCPGYITLKDGRELFIMPDFETAKKVEKHWK